MRIRKIGDDMSRLRNGELSQTKRAIRDREKYAEKRAALRETKMSDEPIGIKGGGDRLPDPLPGDQGDQGDQAAQRYFCSYCREFVGYGDARCETCEEQLNWEGL